MVCRSSRLLKSLALFITHGRFVPEWRRHLVHSTDIEEFCIMITHVGLDIAKNVFRVRKVL